MILLFSGGVDSYVAWYYLGKPKTVYFNVQSRYSRRELGVVKRLIPDTIIDNSLNFSDREVGDKAYIPFRNLILACQAVKYSDKVVIAGLKDDNVSDKNQQVFYKFSDMLTEIEGRSIIVSSPFWDKTKEEVVRWYLSAVGNQEELLQTFSCYAPDEKHYSNVQTPPLGCGKCPACFRKWVALMRNGIDDMEFNNKDLALEYYSAAREGKYEPSRNEAIIKTVEESGWVNETILKSVHEGETVET